MVTHIVPEVFFYVTRPQRPGELQLGAAPDWSVRGADVLVRAGRIAAIEEGLRLRESVQELRLDGQLLLPGLVDTHRHLWAGGLDATIRDVPLGSYAAKVNGDLGARFTPDDVFAGVLWSTVQLIDAGVTAVADWAHNLPSTDAIDADVRALTRSGLRARLFFGGVGQTGAGSHFEQMAEHAAGVRSERVRVGLALPGPAMSDERQVQHDFALSHRLGLPVSLHGGMIGTPPVVEPLHNLGVLDASVNIAHGNTLTERDWELLAAAGATVSVTPTVEVTMGLGAAPAFGIARRHGVTVGFGADTTAYGPADLFGEMRLALAADRAIDTCQHGAPRFDVTHLDALATATHGGAAVLGLERPHGVVLGAAADLIAIDMSGPQLSGADPLLAAFRSATPRDVTTTIVGGTILKQDGRVQRQLFEEARALVAESRNRVFRNLTGSTPS